MVIVDQYTETSMGDIGKQVWKFNYNTDTTELSGVFTASKEDIEWIAGKVVTFKHPKTGKTITSIFIRANMFTLASDDNQITQQLQGTNGIIGHNPFHSLHEPDATEYAQRVAAHQKRQEAAVKAKADKYLSQFDRSERGLQIAAARLRVTLDERLNRVTPPEVKIIAKEHY